MVLEASPRNRTVAAAIGALLVFAACSGPSEPTKSTSASGTSSASESLTFVALGDSWPEGAHCGGCETFAGRYVDGLEDRTGEPVKFVDLTGQAQPFFDQQGFGGTAGLLRALREDDAFADQIATGDVIMVATGPNELDRAFVPYSKGECGKGFACVQRLEAFWHRNFDAILDEIERLRGGQATAVRVLSAANFFVSEPGATEGLPPDAMKFGAAMFKALNKAACATAAAHDGVCVDVRHVLNGPRLDRPVDENSEKSMQAVADALLDTGLPELNR
jgi:hypothetical protein